MTTALCGMTIRLGGRTYHLRPGKPIPETVETHWKKTGEFDGLEKAKRIKVDDKGEGFTRVNRSTKSEPVADKSDDGAPEK